MPPVTERPIFSRNSPRLVTGESFTRIPHARKLRAQKKGPLEATASRIKSMVTGTPVERKIVPIPSDEPMSKGRKKAVVRQLRHFSDHVTLRNVGFVALPIVAAGAIAFHNKFADAISPDNTSQPSQLGDLQKPRSPETEKNPWIDRNVTIRPGFVDIKPGAKLRTSPHIEDANIAGITSETLRVYNPEVVLGAKADPTVRMSSDQLYPNNDPWFSFPIGDKQMFVNAGSATKDVVDTQYAGELTSVNRVRSGQLSYYESPLTGEGLGHTRVELAPPPLP